MFGERLESLRKDLHLSQTELAKKLGISQNAYSKYERGLTEPNMATLSLIASICKVSLDFLITGKESDFRKPIPAGESPLPLDARVSALEAAVAGILNRIEV